MSKEPYNHTAKTAIPFIIVIAFNLFWVVGLVFLQPVFSSLSSYKVEDLSKTIIQTSGILVGFLAASGFFYLGKLGELFNSNFSAAIDLSSGYEAARVNAESYVNNASLMELAILSRCAGCQKNKLCIAMKEQTDFLSRDIKKFNEQAKKNQAEADNSLTVRAEGVNRLAKKTEKTVLVPLITAMFLLFCAIIAASIAYITANSQTVVGCVDLIISGISFTMLTWFLSYQAISSLRNLNEILIKENSASSIIASTIRSAMGQLDLRNALFEKSCLEQISTKADSTQVINKT